jgi:hypothetical protein
MTNSCLNSLREIRKRNLYFLIIINKIFVILFIINLHKINTLY